MARKDQPRKAVSEGYPGIVFFTLIAMLLGIGLIAYELNENYDFVSEPPKIAVRKAGSAPPAKAPEPVAPEPTLMP